MIEIGKKAPAFHIADGDGEKHRLSSYTEHYVVLYFYPKDDTSGCTKEACAFRDLHPDFASLYQMPRSEQEQATFSLALKPMNQVIWGR